MNECAKCYRTDVKCCNTCKKDANKCDVWHNCGSDCSGHDEKVKTNADRIRSMTDEELAEFISKYFSCEYECAVRDKCGSDWDCKRATIDWLQSEVEGE